MHSEHEVSEGQKEPSGPQSDRHIQDILMEEFRLRAAYRILDDLSVSVVVPVRHTVIDASFADADGNLIPDFTSIHHRTETIFGVADIGLGVGFLAVTPTKTVPISLSVDVGTTLPTGGTEPDPFKLGAQGMEHQHLFYGTGTFNPTLGLTLAYEFEDILLSSTTRCQIALMSNDEDYTPPSTLSSEFTTRFRTPVQSLQALVNIGVFKEWAAKWGDVAAKNSGRTDLTLGAGVLWSDSSGFNAALIAKVPLLIDAEGGQLEMPLLLQFTLGVDLGLVD